MMFRSTLALTLVLLAGSTVGAEELKSGPQVGDRISGRHPGILDLFADLQILCDRAAPGHHVGDRAKTRKRCDADTDESRRTTFPHTGLSANTVPPSRLQGHG